MILATETFNLWYILIFVSAVMLATIITCIKTFGRDKKINKINEELMHDEKVLDDETTIIKKKKTITK